MSSRLHNPHAYFNTLQEAPGLACQTLEGTGCTPAFASLARKPGSASPPPTSRFGSFNPT